VYHFTSDEPQYSLTETGDFAIANYNSARPFSSFLPGIAGVNGIPLWAFYVNRGQCVCSLGVSDKDHAIMEFQPANLAYEQVTRHGFRTFLKLGDPASSAFYEPFQSHYRDREIEMDQKMIIAPSFLKLKERNHTLNLTFTVEYVPVPEDSFAGMIRTLRITNDGSDPVTLEGLDGLPVIVPYGVDNHCLKNMRRTIEAFVEVCNLEAQAPFFKAKVEADDRPDVLKISQGHFYLAFESNPRGTALAQPIVDPRLVFGEQTDFGFPRRFLSESIQEAASDQRIEGQLPCAMGAFRTTINAGESFDFVSVIGHSSSITVLNNMIPRLTARDYVDNKSRRNREIVDSISQHGLISSNEPTLDLYARQNFLDNTLRGGLPITLNGKNSRTTLHVFSRKHGDLERDYNDFRVMPTRYSQGNGNFRDINQNRRLDVLINPDVEASNIDCFFNLIQLDGFNPLVLKEVRFQAHDRESVANLCRQYVPTEHQEAVAAFLEQPFTPGSLLAYLETRDGVEVANPDAFLAELLPQCSRQSVSEHGEGFWIDHWTYNLDLIDNYRAVFPDRFSELLFESRRFSYYNNPHRVQAREFKYVLWKGKAVQLNAVVFDKEKASALASLSVDQEKVRTNHGTGEVYHTTLFGKMLCLAVNKLASLDPEGAGVEMEAGKPGWYDALNGLPGLLGSSMCETLELKRCLQFLADQLAGNEHRISEITVFEELREFMEKLSPLLESDLASIAFWDRAGAAKEAYRQKTHLGIGGAEVSVTVPWLQRFIAAALKKIDAGIRKARDPQSNTLITYFRYTIAEYEVMERPDSGEPSTPAESEEGLQRVKPIRFEQQPLPLFLEGPVHYLRCAVDDSELKEFAQNVKSSDLFDTKLKMYKVNASLADQPMEIGRATVFSPGWLENESIWLHMEYKYMLELLRNGLYEEFYEDFRDVFVPFLDPAVYGRSILENCSFLVSSAHPDSSLHGGGFVARLSGATAEFMHILALMAHGSRPFQIGSDGTLQLCLQPALPEWLFTRDEQTIRLLEETGYREVTLPPKSFSFMFLGTILISYYNAALKNTYGPNGLSPADWKLTDSEGQVITRSEPRLEGNIVEKIRQRQFRRIEIELR